MTDLEKINAIHDGIMILFEGCCDKTFKSQKAVRIVFEAAWSHNQLSQVWSVKESNFEKILEDLDFFKNKQEDKG